MNVLAFPEPNTSYIDRRRGASPQLPDSDNTEVSPPRTPLSWIVLDQRVELRVMAPVDPSPTPSENRSWTSQPSNALRKVIVGISLFLLVCATGVVGYLIAGWPLSDALYMVVITIFGVGYAEVQPVTSGMLRAFTILVIVAGYGSVIYAGSGFIQMLFDGEFNKFLGERRMAKGIEQLTGHTIICGFGRMGSELARDLDAAGQDLVVIEGDEQRAQNALNHNHLVVVGDATEEEILARAGIERAEVLASVLGDDAANVFVTLTGRAMNEELSIIARGESVGTENKLKKCGANQVVMPTAIGAAKVSQWILRPSVDELLDRLADHGSAGLDLAQIGLELDEYLIDDSSPLAGRTLSQLNVNSNLGYLIVGVRRQGEAMELHPPPETPLAVGDKVILLGYGDDRPQIAPQLSSTPPTLTYPRVTMDPR